MENEFIAVKKEVIGKKEIQKALETLEEYKKGKESLDNRIVSNEQWFKMRHWDEIKAESKSQSDQNNDEKATSAWLFNSIINKHADAMDNYPEPVVLPREESDIDEAKKLSSILPVIFEQNDYEQTYNDMWFRKLKAGTGVIGVFWDSDKNNGLGDIAIKNVDILKLYWQPGIRNIQDSANFFSVDLVDKEILDTQYPELKDQINAGESKRVAKYIHDDNISTENKVMVVDWYYKQKVDGKIIVQYARFTEDVLLYASENDEKYSNTGFYAHGLYPFDFDVMFMEEDTPAGFSYIDIMKSPQKYIDSLDTIMLKNAKMACKKRFFVKQGAGINKDQLRDWNEDIIDCTTSVDELNIKEFTTSPLGNIYVTLLNNKIDELKETSGNRDFSQGGTASGVTAASAIAALQEAGSKLSRDMIKSSYRSFKRICNMVIELIRQFYDEERYFRVTEENGSYNFVEYSNENIKADVDEELMGVNLGTRLPIFDLVVKAQKSNPFSTAAQNETAKELYRLGFFNPQMAEQATICLSMMSFEGKDQVLQKIQDNSALMQTVQQMQETISNLTAYIDRLNGSNLNQQQDIGAIEQKMPNSSITGGGVVETNSLGKAVKVSEKNTANKARERALNVTSV